MLLENLGALLMPIIMIVASFFIMFQRRFSIMAPSWLIVTEAVLHLLALSADRCLGLHTHGPQSRSSKPPTNENSFLILPSRVNVEEVSKQYPLTIQRRFFSSVPYRDYAVCNVSLGLSSQYMDLITGASSSGKSCLLKMIAGLESPTAGSIRIESSAGDDSTITTGAVAPIAKPVYLDQREYSNSFRSVGEIVTESGKKWRPPDMPELLVQSVVQELRQRLGLGALRVWESKCCDLTQSEAYCLGLLLASIESMFANSRRCSRGEDDESFLLRAPILLLDEVSTVST